MMIDDGRTCHTGCVLLSLILCFSFNFPHLHHQHNGVESDHGQDGVLKRGRHHKMPQAVLERVPVLRHVTGQGLGADGKVYARPLKYREQGKEERKKHETVKTQHAA